MKISSLITSFHQTQFIWKANYLAKLSSSRHLFEKLIFFFGKYNTNTSPYKSHKYNMNFYRYLLFGMQNFCFVILFSLLGLCYHCSLRKMAFFRNKLLERILDYGRICIICNVISSIFQSLKFGKFTKTVFQANEKYIYVLFYI